ncbi:MAG: ATP-binding response regulator, partial [Pyrinomonadaceae bacterium]
AEAVEAVQPAAVQSGVKLDLRPGPGGGAAEQFMIHGDRTRLVQVFWNLLTNAIKFSPADGPAAATVRVRCDDGGDHVLVSVEDEGVGIAPEFLTRVFERFRQADSSMTRAHGGMGIGLALVKSFVEAHGGAVWAESAGPGQGSRFVVQLPIADASIADCELRIDEEGAGEAVFSSNTPPVSDQSAIRNSSESAIPHVLVVEDAPDTLELLRVLFEARGYRVTASESAAEALRRATEAAAHFDIIISDIGLPHTDGLQLLAQLRREHSRLRDVPALALTGYAAQKDVEAALTAGYDAHLAKPVDPAALAELVERLLEAADRRRT